MAAIGGKGGYVLRHILKGSESDYDPIPDIVSERGQRGGYGINDPPGMVERVDEHCRIPRRPTKAGHFLEMKNRAGNPSRSDRLPARCISPLLRGVQSFTETGGWGTKIPHMPRIGGVQGWCTGFLQVLFALLRLPGWEETTGQCGYRFPHCHLNNTAVLWPCMPLYRRYMGMQRS